MSNAIKIGVLGCANIAKRFVIPAINICDNFQLTGVASRSKDKADSFAKTFNTKAFYSYNSLIDSEIDAVYIPLPNSMHYQWIKNALERKLHVLVEKSLACNFEQVKELNQIASCNNLVLIENFQFRFHSQLEFIEDLINDEKIGQLRLVRSCFGFPPFNDENNIRYQKDLGGGALLDAGAYPLKISQIFLGSDIFVDSASLTFKDDKDVDICGSAYIKQKNGDLTSQIAFGFDHYYQNNLELWGANGKLTATRIFTAGPDVKPELVLETKEGKETMILKEDNHFVNLLAHFANCINNKQKLHLEYNQNVNQARLIGELIERAK